MSIDVGILETFLFLGFKHPNFFFIHDGNVWIKNEVIIPIIALFAVEIWRAWRNCNSMWMSHEVIPMYWLSLGTQFMVDSFHIFFSKSQIEGKNNCFIRWNSHNFSCTIINVDRSCNGKLTCIGFGSTYCTKLFRYLSCITLDHSQRPLTSQRYGHYWHDMLYKFIP